MQSNILCDGEIVRPDDDAPDTIPFRSVLPLLTAAAFIIGLLAGLAF